MGYRYRFHWYLDPAAPMNAGRALLGRTEAAALAEAASLWSDGAYAAAVGYIVIDTEDGAVLCNQERAPRARRHGVFQRIS